jgi:electron transport complex protein RnfD
MHSSSRNQNRMTSSQIMQKVLLATIPGVAALTWHFGFGTIINILWACLFAVGFESLALYLRKQQIVLHLKDNSTFVTAVLLGICLPPASSWWLILIGTGSAILIAKHLYGGLGRNLFNPAMIGYAILLLLFPAMLNTWFAPYGISQNTTLNLFDAVQKSLGITANYDAVAMATALDVFKQNNNLLISELWRQSSAFGIWGGRGWEWVNLGFLAGGLYLLQQRIFTWHIPAGMLLGLSVMALFFYHGGNASSGGSPLFHLFSGGTMLGAFFIATDPVTSATSTKGKFIYSLAIGVLVYIIRHWGIYPDGIVFSVLLMNFLAPVIDHYTKDRRENFSIRNINIDNLLVKTQNRNIWISFLLILFSGMIIYQIYLAATDGVSNQRDLETLQILNELIPEDLHDNDLLRDTRTISDRTLLHLDKEDTDKVIYIARKNHHITGVVLPVSVDGYSGKIDLLVAITADGKLSGVRVINHTEKFGLGEQSPQAQNHWLEQLKGSAINLDQKKLALRKDGGDFDQMTGATVTSRAVIDATHRALRYFSIYQNALLSESAVK